MIVFTWNSLKLCSVKWRNVTLLKNVKNVVLSPPLWCDPLPSSKSSPLCLRFQIEWRSFLREDTPFNIQTPPSPISCDLKSKNASQFHLNQDEGQKLDTSRSKTGNYRKLETVAKLFVIIDQPIQSPTYFQHLLYTIPHSFRLRISPVPRLKYQLSGQLTGQRLFSALKNSWVE